MLGPRSGTCSRLPTDPRPDLVRIGRVGRPHGVDGAFVVEDASQDERRFEVGAELLVDGEPARVVTSRRVGGRRHAVKLDRPVERGAELALPRERLPELPADAYYVSDLVGMDVLELDSGQLLPLVEDCIREVDLCGRRVILNPGFID